MLGGDTGVVKARALDGGALSLDDVAMARRHQPELAESVEEAIVLTLFELATHLQRGGEALAAPAKLTTQQWLALLQIAGDPNFSSRSRASLASEIARARGVSRATLSVQLAALRKRGLIDERIDPEDARRRHLVLTPQGVDVIGALQPARKAANLRLLGHLTVADRERFLRYLRSCLDVMWELYEADQTTAARARLDRPAVSARSTSRRRNPKSRNHRPGR